MGILLVVIIGIVIGIIKLIVYIIKQIFYSRKNKKAYNALSNAILSLTDMSYKMNCILLDENGYKNSGIVIDERIAKVCLFKRKNNIVDKTVHNFYELVSIQIVENNCQVVTDNSLDIALVGGALFGLSGALVGGMLGNKNTTNKINEISLKLVFRDFAVPFYKFVFFKEVKGINRTSNNNIQLWYSRFSIIVDDNKKYSYR